MYRLKWRYLLNIFLLLSLLTPAIACDELNIPETLTPESTEHPSASIEGLPVIIEFNADPNESMAAEDAVLHWYVSGASNVLIEPGVGDVALSGERSVSPTENTTYTLTAFNEMGSVTATTEVYFYGIATTAEALPLEWLEQELQEQPEQSGIVWIDPKTEEPMLRLTEELDKSELKEPGATEELTKGLTPKEASALPIIRRFEVQPSAYTMLWQLYRVYFEVPNASYIMISWPEGAVWARYLSERTSYVWWSYSTGAEWILLRIPYTLTLTLDAWNNAGHSSENITMLSDRKRILGPSSLEPVTPEPEHALETRDLHPINPVIHHFTVNPESIVAGNNARLSWEVSNAERIEVNYYYDGSVRSHNRPGSIGISERWGNTMTIMPSETRKYFLIAYGPDEKQWLKETIILKVEQPASGPIDLPTINYFSAVPKSITSGDSSKLSWEVLNADTVAITAVSLKTKVSSAGSMAVSPSATTTYTLTATNTAGSQTQSITVTVEGSTLIAPPKLPSPTEKAKPDLVITDIWRVGSTQWYYTIKNQGKVECNGSSSQLIIDDKPQAIQSIGSLAAGESRQVYFSYKYACETETSHTWAVVADAKSAIDESDEENNSHKEKFTCSK